MDGQVREGGNWSKQAALTYGWASQEGRESEQASGTHQRMGKEGRESEQARALINWKADGQAVSMGGNGARKSTHLWMSKSGREGIGASEWHSPMDGQVREGENWSEQEHSPMDEQVREGGNQSKQAALTYGWASQGGTSLLDLLPPCPL